MSDRRQQFLEELRAATPPALILTGTSGGQICYHWQRVSDGKAASVSVADISLKVSSSGLDYLAKLTLRYVLHKFGMA